MLVNSYYRLRAANPGPSRLLGGFFEYAEAPRWKAGLRSQLPVLQPTHCRPSVRTGYAQTIAILQRDLTLSHPRVVHLLRRGGLPNPFSSSWPPEAARSMQPKNGTFHSAKAGWRTSGRRRCRLNRLSDTLAFGNTGEYNCVGCLYLLGELRFEQISAQNRPA
jgi:hypothetical protein